MYYKREPLRKRQMDKPIIIIHKPPPCEKCVQTKVHKMHTEPLMDYKADSIYELKIYFYFDIDIIKIERLD